VVVKDFASDTAGVGGIATGAAVGVVAGVSAAAAPAFCVCELQPEQTSIIAAAANTTAASRRFREEE
jgi:folate-dependent tRNA-U54 methylase TrmFO/GidA